MTLDEIIKKLEKATGPDRPTDYQIHCLINGWEMSEGGVGYCFVTPTKHGRRELWFCDIPAYTASLDAALALKPKNWRVTHAYWADDDSDPGATFNLTLPQALTQQPSKYASGHHRQIATALCIAALHARRQS